MEVANLRRRGTPFFCMSASYAPLTLDGARYVSPSIMDVTVRRRASTIQAPSLAATSASFNRHVHCMPAPPTSSLENQTTRESALSPVQEPVPHRPAPNRSRARKSNDWPSTSNMPRRLDRRASHGHRIHRRERVHSARVAIRSAPFVPLWLVLGTI
jgi:hypothetical protein